MPRAKNNKKSAPGRRAIVYTVGGNGKMELILPVSSPSEIQRSLGLSKTARQRVERVLRKAGLRRKAS